jgi:RNA polymerase sigma-70 factor (ECF subfamily)
MSPSNVASTPSAVAREEQTVAHARLERMVAEHLDGLWRFARRLGVAEVDVDDVLQEVIMITATRLDDVQLGSERAFLFATTFRLASGQRRWRVGRREVSDDALLDVHDAAPDPESLADDRRAREALDRILDEMPIDLRAVFVLYEIEEHSMIELAQVLDIPQGTVASRLRRARAHFDAAVRRLQARTRFEEGA